MINLPRGFLPDHDPLTHLPAIFGEWESTAVDLPKWLMSRRLRTIIENLPVFPSEKLSSPPELERAMLILSTLGQAYVWADLQHPATSLPASIAVPWRQVAARLGRPPILSYASYALHNWRRLNPHQEIELGNLVLLQNFLGGMDEEWFILVHVDIEAKAIPGLQAILPAFAAVTREDLNGLAEKMEMIRQALTNMCATLNRMPECCDPYIYYHRVRPYIHGWKNNPALPEGIVYSGVAEYGNKPVKFKGETGAQSSIIPAMDAAFGIGHADNPLKAHLLEMQDYMPEKHRQFLSEVIKNNNIRDFVQKHRHEGNIRDLYNGCLGLLHEFRAIHLRYAAQYIQKQNQSSSGNPTDVGTGGTPFMEYLRQHREETEKKLI